MRVHLKKFTVFPSGSDEWLEEKAARDCQLGGVPADLWLIGDTLYDLSRYLNDHPGGRMWLEMTRGTDATVAFEAHHMNYDRAVSAMKRYAVRKVPANRVGGAHVYEWSDSGFFRSTRAEAWQVLRQNGGTGPTAFMHVLCTTALVMFATAFSLTCATKSGKKFSRSSKILSTCASLRPGSYWSSMAS